MQYLDLALREYADADWYPFHMPGHKRQPLPFADPYRIDITEIDGFDNLHHAEGILKEGQERAARLYGSDRCFYLVNGSTCGLLAAICGATEKGDRVLVARNSHKAVYHGLYLNQLSAEYLYPMITEQGLQGQITPEQVRAALQKDPDIRAVILTSPTYEGIVSDIAGIAAEVHAHDIPLIVDSAHGAHLGFGYGFPENAVRLGADAVIMSLHKTLPSFTQTALLHLNGTRISIERVKKYLGIFQTSSPSYIFMAGMDACVRLLEEQREELFAAYQQRLLDFYRGTKGLKRLHVLGPADMDKSEAFGWDPSKIVIFTDGGAASGNTGADGHSGLTGAALQQLLRERYHLEMEMASGDYVLGMTSIMDRKEGFDRLREALCEIDAALTATGTAAPENGTDGNAGAAVGAGIDVPHGNNFVRRMYGENLRAMELCRAMDLPAVEVSFEEAVGRISADFIYLYPPGIPMLVPGEVITEEFIGKIGECLRQNLQIEGSPGLSRRRINIVNFERVGYTGKVQ